MSLLDAILAKAIAGASGTTDYSELENKPKINNVTLQGNKTAANLGLQTTLQYDKEPSQNSNKLVKSGDLFDYMNEFFTPIRWTRCSESPEFELYEENTIKVCYPIIGIDGNLKLSVKIDPYGTFDMDGEPPIPVNVMIKVVSARKVEIWDEDEEIIGYEIAYDDDEIVDTMLYANVPSGSALPKKYDIMIPIASGQRIEIHFIIMNGDISTELPAIDEDFFDIMDDSYFSGFLYRDYSGRVSTDEYIPTWSDEYEDDDD